MRGRFKNFPADYLVADVETTGVELGLDLVGQLGYALVLDGKIADSGWVYLDWTRHPQVDQKWLGERIDSTRRHMESSGRSYSINYEGLARGMDVPTALARYLNLFLEARSRGLFFVFHNGYHFDVPMLHEHFATFIDAHFRFGDFEVYDTGMVEKGAQINATAWEGDSVKSFSRRVSLAPMRGVKWSLDGFCIPRYGLDKKAGLRADEVHDAAVDCVFTHFLFQEHRLAAERYARSHG